MIKNIQKDSEKNHVKQTKIFINNKNKKKKKKKRKKVRESLRKKIKKKVSVLSGT